MKYDLIEASFTLAASQASPGDYKCIANKAISKLCVTIERAKGKKVLPSEWTQWTKWYVHLINLSSGRAKLKVFCVKV